VLLLIWNAVSRRADRSHGDRRQCSLKTKRKWRNPRRRFDEAAPSELTVYVDSHDVRRNSVGRQTEYLLRSSLYISLSVAPMRIRPMPLRATCVLPRVGVFAAIEPNLGGMAKEHGKQGARGRHGSGFPGRS